MANGTIKYNVDFSVNKNGLNQLKSELQSVKTIAQQALSGVNTSSLNLADQELKEIITSANQLEGALDRAFNTNLGTLNVSKFNQELQKLNLNKIQADFAKAGTAGQNAFRNMATQVLTTNMQLKQTHSLIDNMATTMANTVKWGIASSIMNGFTRSVQNAYGYVKKLDTSLNNIMLVTDKSAENMKDFAKQANKAAKELGASTTAYTDAALIYYQQGLGDKEVAARAETTLKAANVTSQSGEEVSEQLTAVWNGYKVTAEETEIYVDKLAKVAATTASDLEELSKGMSKVASAANSMGVDVDQLNAQLATIISVTRQAPESVGTALKTIYARMGDLAVDGEDEFGVSLGEVSGKMEQMGIQIMDQQGNLRDMGTVIEETAKKWDTWTESQKQAAAVAMAGKRQYNNLIALFENWGMYEKALNTSANSVGFLQEQQEEYMESMQAHLQELRTATESLYTSLIDSDGMNELVDGLTLVVNLFDQFVQSIGGGGNLLLGLGSIGLRVFSKQIASGLTTTLMNLKASKENTEQLRAEMEMLGKFSNLQQDDSRYQRIVEMKKQELQYEKMLSAEERELSNEYIRQTNELFKQQDILEQRKIQAEEVYAQMFNGTVLNLNTSGAGVQASKDLEGQLVDFQQEQKEIANTVAAYKEYARVSIEAAGDKDILKTATDNYLAVADTELTQVTALLQKNKLTEEQELRLTAAIAQYTDARKLSVESGAIVSETMTAGNKLHEEYSQILSEIIKKLTQAKKTTDSYEKEFNDLNNKIENGRIAFSKFISTAQMKNFISNLTQGIGALGQFAMALNTFGNIKNIWNNDNLNTFEKTTQIVSSATMAITSFSFSLKGLKTGYEAITTLLSGFNKWLTVQTDATVNQTMRQKMLNIAKAQSITLDETESTLAMRENLQQQLTNKLIQEEIARRKARGIEVTKEMEAEIAEIAIKQANNKLQRQEITQDQIETITSKKKTAQLWAEVAAKMAKHWYILVIIAALGALAAITYAVVKAENKEAEALKEASENAKKAKEEYQALQEELANFNTHVEKYSELKDALVGLTAGTDEYRLAVMELNAEVLELISKYPILTEYLENTNGVLGISTNGWQALYESQLQAAGNAYINTLSTQIDERDAQLDVDLKNQAKNSKEYKGRYISGYSSGGAANYKFDSVQIDKDTLKAYGEAYLTHGENLFTNSTLLKQIGLDSGLRRSELGRDENDTLISALTENASTISGASLALTDFEKRTKEVQESQDALKAEIIKAAIAIHASTIATNQLRQQKYDSFIENSYLDTLRSQTKSGEDISAESEIYAQYMSMGEGEQSAVASLIGQYEKEHVEDTDWSRDGWLFNWSWSNFGAAESDADVQEAYAKAMGYDVSKTENNSGKATYYRPGSDEGVEISDKYAREFLNDRAKSEIATTEYGQQAIQIVNTMSSAASESAKNLGYDEDIQKETGNLLAGHFAGVSNLGLASDESLKAIQSMGEDVIADMVTDEQAQDAGYKDAEAYAKALNSEVEYQLGEGAEARAAAIAKKEQEEYNTVLEQGAKELEVSKDALDGYAKFLMKNNKELAKNKKAAADAAVAHAKFSKGVDSLREALDDNIEVLEEWDEDALETYEASAKVEEALKDIFGVDVDADFVHDNLEKIKGLAEGDVDALNDLSAELAKEQVMDLTIEESVKNEISAVIDEMNALRNLPDAEIGMSFDDSDFINKMNKLLENGDITAEQLQGIFNSIGFKPDLKMKTIEGKPTTTKQKIYGDIFGNRTKLAEYEIETTNSVQVPYIAAEGTEMAADESGFGGQESGSGITMTSTANSLIGSLGNNITNSKIGEDKNKKDLEPLEDEKDLYHDINIEIQQLENSMEELQSQQDKLYGQDLLNNLQKQLNLLEQQEDAQRRKLEIAKQEAATLKSTLAGQGTAFNADGTIANYATLYDQKLAYVNSVIASGDEDAADAVQKAFEAWVENVERYDELISSEIPEIDQTIRDMMDERIEKQIEAFEYEITLKLDMKDAERDWNDFKKNMTIDEDDILGSAKFSFNNLGTYLSNDGTIATLTDQSNTLLDQLAQMNATGTSSIYGDNRAALMEDIAENQDALMAAMEEQKDLLDEIEQAYFDMLDAAQEAFDEQVAQYEAINEVYSHGLNVINVLYGEDAYAEMEDFYQSTIENTNDLISFQAKQVQMWKEKLNDPSLTDEQRDEIQKKMQEAQAAVLSSVETQLDNIINKYTNAINKIFKELEDKMTGGKGMSYIQEEWDLLNKNADMYLDQVNSAYEVEKLAREYNKAIDATDSLSAQRKLNELMEEQLKGLREKEKLTQYDVDRANALLDIELKRIALEEAQQNKSKMRLRRDASGNYSYQFVSDEDATAQAQQELADAQNSLYNLDKDAYKENLDAIVQLEQEFTEKYAEVMLDTTLTEEERQAKRLLLEEQYNEMMNNLLAQNTALRINLEDTALQEMSNLNQSYLMEELIPGWNSGVQEMASFMTGEGGLLPTCADSFAELSGVTQQYITDLDTLEAVAGVDLSNVAGYTDAIVNSMTPVLENNDELIDKYNEEIRLMGELQTEAQTLAQTYNGITTAAMAAVDAMLAARKTEADIDAEKAAQEAAAQQQAANEAAAAAQQQAAQQPSLAVGTGVTVKTTATHFSRDGGNGTRMKSFVPGGSYAVMQVSGNEVLIGRGGVATGWVNKTDLVGFRTGGYTGDWADAKGRLAVLHQKELVLNSKDTQNILRAVDVVRQIDGIMSSIMGNAFNKINNQINGLNSMSFPVGGPTSSEAAVAQHIEINADFPGVEKASEIISAFENLTNMATQYAFKTDR